MLTQRAQCLQRGLQASFLLTKQQIFSLISFLQFLPQTTLRLAFNMTQASIFQCQKVVTKLQTQIAHMNTVNKIFTCLCCSYVACEAACCIDHWHSIEACGFAYVECGNCCWTVCAPICHTCTIGDFGTGMNHCVAGIKYCLYSCALSSCAPIDGIYNCVSYIGAICGSGVTGCGDILKNVDFIGQKIRSAFEFPDTPQPTAKFTEYRP